MTQIIQDNGIMGKKMEKELWYIKMVQDLK